MQSKRSGINGNSLEHCRKDEGVSPILGDSSYVETRGRILARLLAFLIACDRREVLHSI